MKKIKKAKVANRCQDCRFHENNPSRCLPTNTYVGRKHKCDRFIRGK